MKSIRTLTLTTTIAMATIFGGLVGTAHAAGNASLSVAGGSHSVGSSFSVPIYVSSADPVNVVQADFTYDASQLQFQGVSCGGAFGITADSGANTVTCGVSSGGSVSGSQLVAFASFKALSGSGSSDVSIASSSHVYSATDNSDIWNGVPTSAGISFYTPVPVAAAPTAPVTPTAAPAKVVKKHITPVVAPVKAPSKTGAWAKIVILSGLALLLAVAAIWAARHPKQYKKYRKTTQKFVDAKVARPSKRIFKQSLQVMPFNK